MALPPRLALATKNPGKIREILEICRSWDVEWVLSRPAGNGAAGSGRLTVVTSGWPDVEESGATYLDNALIKARAAAVAQALPAVADDSGIEVDSLEGGPGPRSARFAGPDASDQDNLRLLIERIRGVPSDERSARYRCVAACAWPNGREVWAEGVCEGRLMLEPRGGGGFGYDPIFVPEGQDRTMAELPPEAKNAISHRGQALRALGEILSAADPAAG